VRSTRALEGMKVHKRYTSGIRDEGPPRKPNVVWRRCGMGGLAGYPPDTARHTGQPQAARRGPAGGAAVRPVVMVTPLRCPRPAPPAGGEQAGEASLLLEFLPLARRYLFLHRHRREG